MKKQSNAEVGTQQQEQHYGQFDRRKTAATPEELLNDAIQAMTDLHDAMKPDEREDHALVPPVALRKFVDTHARLMYERERMTQARSK